MSVYKLPSGAATVDMAHTMGSKDYTYPASKKQITLALQEALEELWVNRSRVDELEAEVKYWEDLNNERG